MYKILVADDEPGVVSLLKDYFEINGYEVITAKNGREAIENMKKNPDMILLDINMPDGDGLSVCRQIRDYVSCPILFLTARIEDNDKIEGFAAGGDDYMLKPFSIDELGARVAAHIRRDHRGEAQKNVRFFWPAYRRLFREVRRSRRGTRRFCQKGISDYRAAFAELRTGI